MYLTAEEAAISEINKRLKNRKKTADVDARVCFLFCFFYHLFAYVYEYRTWALGQEEERTMGDHKRRRKTLPYSIHKYKCMCVCTYIHTYQYNIIT